MGKQKQSYIFKQFLRVCFLHFLSSKIFSRFFLDLYTFSKANEHSVEYFVANVRRTIFFRNRCILNRIILYSAFSYISVKIYVYILKISDLTQEKLNYA